MFTTQTSSEVMFPQKQLRKDWRKNQRQDVHCRQQCFFTHDGDILFDSEREEDNKKVPSYLGPTLKTASGSVVRQFRWL